MGGEGGLEVRYTGGEGGGREFQRLGALGGGGGGGTSCHCAIIIFIALDLCQNAIDIPL